MTYFLKIAELTQSLCHSWASCNVLLATLASASALILLLLSWPHDLGLGFGLVSAIMSTSLPIPILCYIRNGIFVHFNALREQVHITGVLQTN